MANKIGKLIKQARTDAGLTQEQLAKKVKNTSAADLSKAERGELKLSQDALKQIAKATGVTQKSLLDAAASSTYKTASSSGSSKSAAGKTSASKTSSAKKTTTSKSTSTKSSSAKSTTTKSSSGTSMKVTATEKKILELYREADSDTKKKVQALLKGDSSASGVSDVLENLIGGALDLFTNK